MIEEIVVAHTKAWIERLVIGENLCPFAAVPYRKERIRYRVLTSDLSAEEWANTLLSEGRLLLDPDQAIPLDTTLLILPQGWSVFADYLELVAVLEDIIADAGWAGDIQLATFHPDYQFAQSEKDDPANYTNRSPYPMLHLLREDLMEEALIHYPHPERIPEVNVARMRAMGAHTLEELLQDIKSIKE